MTDGTAQCRSMAVCSPLTYALLYLTVRINLNFLSWRLLIATLACKPSTSLPPVNDCLAQFFQIHDAGKSFVLLLKGEHQAADWQCTRVPRQL